MISLVLWYSFKYTILLSLYGWAMTYGVVVVSEAIQIQLPTISKKKVWLLFTMLFCSIAALSWIAHIDFPINELVLQAISSFIVGSWWSWIFLEFLDAMGFSSIHPNKVQLWVAFSVFIFVLYPYLG